MASGSQILTNSSRTILKSSPLLELNAPMTFSQIANLGYSPFVASLISLMILMASINRPLRVVSSSPFSSCFKPALLPAIDKSWHGDPNVTMSTGSMSQPLIPQTFPRCIMLGNRLFVTAIGYGSTSEAHFGSMPQSAPANGKPPEPSNKLPKVYICFSFLPNKRAV